MNYNCPKCKTLLFRRGKDFYCIGCSLHGQYPEMENQAAQVKIRVRDHATKVECKLCNIRKRLAFEVSCCTRNGKSEYICFECQALINRDGRN